MAHTSPRQQLNKVHLARLRQTTPTPPMSCTGHRDAFPRHDSASTSSAKTLLSPLTFAKYTPASRRSSERWEAGRLQGRSAALPTPLQHLRPNLRVRTHPEPLQKSTQPSTTTASSSASPLATGVTPALQANIHPTSTLPDRPSLRSAHPPSSYNPVKLYDDAPRRSYERWRSSPIKTNALGIGEEEAVVFSRRHSTIGVSTLPRKQPCALPRSLVHWQY